MKKAYIAGGVVAIALCAMIMPRLFTRKQFADPVADPIVEAEQPQTRDIRLTTALVGNVEPEDVIYIYPKAGGDVTSVSVKAGDTVEVGDLLCEIDTKQVESAKSSFDSASLALKQAQENLSRQEILYAGGGISQQEYESYQDQVTSAQINYDSAKTNYENQVSYSQITAPISGTVEICDIQVYDQVTQNNLICVISGEGDKKVSFSVTERIKNALKEGDTIQVEKDGASYEGTIYEISTMADTTSGLYPVKALLADNGDASALSTGSTVKLYVTSEHADQVMTVPVNAVYYDDGLSYVYTYDEASGTLHKIQVQTGIYDADYIEIQSGLNGDEKVLTTWSSELYEGASARLKGEETSEVQPAEPTVEPVTESAAQS